MAKSAHGLTAQRLTFALGILEGKLQRLAALDAGYSAKSADSIATQLLRDPKVSAFIQSRRTKQLSAVDVSAERILKELARIGFSDLRKAITWGRRSAAMVPSTEMEEDTALAIQSIKVKTKTTRYKDAEGNDVETHMVELEPRMYGKLEALDKLARHAGLYKRDEDDGDEDAEGDAKAARIREQLDAMDKVST